MKTTENAGPGMTAPGSVGGRIEKWDVLKGVLIYLVVLGHLCDAYTRESSNMKALFLWIYSFHMPLFIFVSGLFSKRTVDGQKYEKIFPLLVVYLLAKIIRAVPSGIRSGTISFSILSEGGVPWFIFALAVFYLVTMYLKRFPKWWVFIISIVFSCMAGYDENIGIFLSAARIIMYYPFFFAGYCLDAEKISRVTAGKRVKLLAAVFVAALIFIIRWKVGDLYFIRRLLVGKYPYSALADYGKDHLIIYGAFIRLAYYAAAFAECFALIAITPDHCRALSWFGKRTLPVYVFQYTGVDLWLNTFHMKTVMSGLGISNYCILPAAFLIMLVFSLPPFVKITDWCMHPEIFTGTFKNGKICRENSAETGRKSAIKNSGENEIKK